MSGENNRRVAPSEKILLDAGEAAEMLSISKPTLYRLMQIEGFPVVMIGARRLVKRKELSTWIDQHSEALQ